MASLSIDVVICKDRYSNTYLSKLLKDWVICFEINHISIFK